MKLRQFLSLAAVLAATAFFLGYLQEQPARAVFLSVGQGDSTLLSAEGVHILVDAGPGKDGYDAAKPLILPKLRKLGVDRLALLFITHPDADHLGGARTILRRYPSARLVANRVFQDHPDMITLLRESRIPLEQVIWVQGTTRWSFGDANLTCYAPEPGIDDNEASLVLRFEYERAAVVLSGDAPKSMEIEVAAIGDWSAQAMSAGHHGSRGSTSPEWLREVSPQYVVASCGIDNQYSHPALETIDIIQKSGSYLYRTDLDGDVAFEFDEGRLTPEPAPDQMRRR